MRNIKRSDLQKRTLAVMVVLAMSTLLALPALLYLIKLTTLTNLLSLLVSMGLFFFIILLIRNVYVQTSIGILILLLNSIEIVHIAIFGHPISLGGVASILYTE